jgi:hypothetical protein
MITMNQSLLTMVRAGVLSKADAYEYSLMPDEMAKALSTIRDRERSK